MTDADIGTKPSNTTPVPLRYKHSESLLPPWLFPVTMAVSMTTFLVISFALHHRRFLLKRRRLYQHHSYLLRHHRVAGPVSLSMASLVHHFGNAVNPNIVVERPKKLWGSKRLRRCYSWSPRIFKPKDEPAERDSLKPNSPRKHDVSGKFLSTVCSVHGNFNSFSRQAVNRLSSGSRKFRRSGKSTLTMPVRSDVSDREANEKLIVPPQTDDVDACSDPLSVSDLPGTASTNSAIDPDGELKTVEELTSPSNLEPTHLAPPPYCDISENVTQSSGTRAKTQSSLKCSAQGWAPPKTMLKNLRSQRCHSSSDACAQSDEDKELPVFRVTSADDVFLTTSSASGAFEGTNGKTSQDCCTDSQSGNQDSSATQQTMHIPRKASRLSLPRWSWVRRSLSRRKRRHVVSTEQIHSDEADKNMEATNSCFCDDDIDDTVFNDSEHLDHICLNESATTGKRHMLHTDKSLIYTAVHNLLQLFFEKSKWASEEYEEILHIEETFEQVEQSKENECKKCNEVKRILSRLVSVNDKLNAGFIPKESAGDRSIVPKPMIEDHDKENSEDYFEKSVDEEADNKVCEEPATMDKGSSESFGRDYLDLSLASLHDSLNSSLYE